MAPDPEQARLFPELSGCGDREREVINDRCRLRREGQQREEGSLAGLPDT
jgi:hypothetical protein